MIIASAGFTFSFTLIVAATNVAMIMVGRFFSGVFCGFSSVVVPVYVSETASPRIRGLLGSFFQVEFTEEADLESNF